jgi:FkbM family methyltransferase
LKSITLVLEVLKETLGFYGRHNPLSLAFARASWGQCGEDLLIADLLNFDQLGFYVDVGAYNPYALSNTYYFYRRGWRGINIDPLPKAISRLNRFRSRDKNLQFAIDIQRGQRNFLSKDVYSSFAGSKAFDYSEHLIVDTIPLACVLNEQGLKTSEFLHRPNFLSVDCEGADLDVLRSNDWAKYPFSVVAVEDHSKSFWSSEISDYMQEIGYTLRARSNLTSIFKKQDEH